MRYGLMILLGFLIVGCGSDTKVKSEEVKVEETININGEDIIIGEKDEVKSPLSPKLKDEKLSPPSIPSL